MCVYTTVIFFSVQHTKASEVSKRSRSRRRVEESKRTRLRTKMCCFDAQEEIWNRGRKFESGMEKKKIKQQENYYTK